MLIVRWLMHVSKLKCSYAAHQTFLTIEPAYFGEHKDRFV